MFKSLFPSYFYEYLLKTPIEKINELRLRLNKKIVVNISNKSYFLSINGLTGDKDRAIICEKNLIDEILKRGCDNSVYAYVNQIKNGFITVKGGIRIGLGGEGVFEKNYIKTLKNINSLALRFPHEVKGCSKKVLPYILQNSFLNTLIVSPPGAGKTTMIRDIILQLSERDYCYNVLLIDERGEIANCFDGEASLDLGNFCDVMTATTKDYAFENGIRSLRPDIIATDELTNQSDYNAVQFAKNCGVSILASIHAKNISELKNKPEFYEVLKNKTFDRFLFLSNVNGPGTIEAIYDENLKLLS